VVVGETKGALFSEIFCARKNTCFFIKKKRGGGGGGVKRNTFSCTVTAGRM